MIYKYTASLDFRKVYKLATWTIVFPFASTEIESACLGWCPWSSSCIVSNKYKVYACDSY